jgi:hypothetical protein
MQWDAAETEFRSMFDERPKDTACDAYLRKIEENRETPPEPGWDAVYVMTSK